MIYVFYGLVKPTEQALSENSKNDSPLHPSTDSAPVSKLNHDFMVFTSTTSLKTYAIPEADRLSLPHTTTVMSVFGENVSTAKLSVAIL